MVPPPVAEEAPIVPVWGAGDLYRRAPMAVEAPRAPRRGAYIRAWSPDRRRRGAPWVRFAGTRPHKNLASGLGSR